MAKISSLLRIIALAALVIVAAVFCGARLLQIQIVDGEMYLAMTKSVKVTTQEIEAARGQVADSAGNILNTNKMAYNLNLQYQSLKEAEGSENEIIYRLLTVLIKNGDKWNDTLPITVDAPYTFLTGKGKDKDIEKLKEIINVANYSSAEDCMFWLCKTFEIDEKYDEKMRRYIAGVRYEMELHQFSEYNSRFVLSSEISQKSVTELKELDNMLEGVDITQNWERVYLDGTTAPHLRGVVGAISEEQYEELKDEGYRRDDIIGREGIEKSLEELLHGKRGERTITRSSEVTEIKEEITAEPQAGNSIRLTFDSKYQRLMQDALKYHIDYLNSEYMQKSGNNYTQYKGGCTAGAIVVLDVKTAGVLAAATYPSYDLNDMVKDYSEVLNREGKPLLNRALFGEYRPGSTFKTITATAGLAEGAITPTSLISCGHVYPYYGGGFTCLGWHGGITVKSALQYSCNIFFYETARRIGIDKLALWGSRFGVGEDLGLELDMAPGHMSSLEYFEEMGYDWFEGNIVQAGIGQCETALTPMHLATQAMTLANKGVRYEPHIVKSVYNYDMSEKLYDIEPKIADDFSGLEGMPENMEAIKAGMKLMADTQDSIPDRYYENAFKHLGVGGTVALKSGTPQVTADTYNSAAIGFYPAEDPQIAFGIYLENGEYAKCLAAQVVYAYASGKISTSFDEKGVPTLMLGEKQTLEATES